MNQAVEYKVWIERVDGSKFGERYFTNKKKALEYAKALEKKYMHLVIHMIEI